MNREVIYKGTTAIVKDEYENKRVVSCTDNLCEILIQENVIEIIEDIIKSLEYESSIFVNNKNINRSYISVPIISTFLVPIIMTYIASNQNMFLMNGTIMTKFGLMEIEKFVAIFIGIFLPLGYKISKKYYLECKEGSKYEMCRQLALEDLRENLEVQRLKLEEMRSKSVLVESREDKPYLIDDTEFFNDLLNHICIYFGVGYNIKEYYKYYIEHGELPDELKIWYNEEDIHIIEELLKKRGSSFVKVKKLKRNK